MTLAGAAGHGLPLRHALPSMTDPTPSPFVLAFVAVLAGILPAGEPSE